MARFKDEKELVNHITKKYIFDRAYVRKFVNTRSMLNKLKKEDALDVNEEYVLKQLTPEIDLIWWPKQYSGDPQIQAAEVKYFRFSKGNLYPEPYDGWGQAIMMLGYGFDAVHLWHFFDYEISKEQFKAIESYMDNVAKHTSINYKAVHVSEGPEIIISGVKPLDPLDAHLSFLMPLQLKTNALRYDEMAQQRRRIIKKLFRIVA